MFRKIYLILLLLLFAFQVFPNTPQLTENSKVILFTCTPGTELYAGFGHSAIWISDPENRIDKLYNYGMFNFETPHFYWKFTRGKLEYMLAITSARRFMAEYKYRQIGVTGQTLNLTLAEKQKLYDLLQKNYLPQNRYYKYDFFYDNCATRIRDIVEKTVDGEISYNTPDKQISFRQLLFPYLKHSPWTKLGINIILGLSSDKIATPYDYMYLPEHMQEEYSLATINNSNGETRRLVKQERQYLESELIFKSNTLTHPIIIFGLLLLLIGALSVWEYQTGNYQKWLDITLNIIGIIAGIFLFFMWVGTDHSATNQNMNILWLFPAQAIFMYSLFINKKKQIKLLLASLIIILAVAVLMFICPQETEISFLLLSLLFAIRYFFKIKILKKTN